MRSNAEGISGAQATWANQSKGDNWVARAHTAPAPSPTQSEPFGALYVLIFLLMPNSPSFWIA